MSKNLFIPIPREEFKTELEAMVQTAVKDAVEKALEKTNGSSYNIVNTDELTTILRSSKMAIHNWRNEGWLPFYKLGSKVLFNLDEVMEAIRKRNGRKGKRKNKKNLSA